MSKIKKCFLTLLAVFMVLTFSGTAAHASSHPVNVSYDLRKVPSKEKVWDWVAANTHYAYVEGIDERDIKECEYSVSRDRVHVGDLVVTPTDIWYPVEVDYQDILPVLAGKLGVRSLYVTKQVLHKDFPFQSTPQTTAELKVSFSSDTFEDSSMWRLTEAAGMWAGVQLMCLDQCTNTNLSDAEVLQRARETVFRVNDHDIKYIEGTARVISGNAVSEIGNSCPLIEVDTQPYIDQYNKETGAFVKAFHSKMTFELNGEHNYYWDYDILTEDPSESSPDLGTDPLNLPVRFIDADSNAVIEETNLNVEYFHVLSVAHYGGQSQAWVQIDLGKAMNYLNSKSNDSYIMHPCMAKDYGAIAYKSEGLYEGKYNWNGGYPLPVYVKKGALKADTIEMHRLYNPNSGEHFYTGSEGEFRYLVQIGWDDEGMGWIAPEKSNTPVYRLYNPNAGDHHYTSSAAERDHLVSVGWKYEQIGWYSDDDESVPLYRQYNPNAKQAGAHNYTTSLAENNFLVSRGWKAEGIGWYGCR